MYLPYTIEELRDKTEVQIMDRKSVRIDPKDLAKTIIAFANADGGWIAIGIEDNGDITGVDNFDKQVNELLLAPVNLCIPSVIVETEFVEHIANKGNYTFSFYSSASTLNKYNFSLNFLMLVLEHNVSPLN